MRAQHADRHLAWSLDRIKPYEKNPRINDDAVAPVVQSINDFGFRQPIVVDPDGVIIVGHTRWKAAKQLNLAEVPVHVATDLEPEAVTLPHRRQPHR
ncbi:MAG: ParB N-terminal domain-containing protein [Pirellulaceae bacterium]